ncbi:hypothetical protein HAZT_HAZT004416 [Hyalella azteca]|uniref:C-type lectin domain-containing protein n=1 Tax=Hyalella azteca TaxID=294128 RepID=A0A6A0GNT4_HYAAZ|nr:hypothetical protein HAZT_HAZT004416 [Hyalella azteca]
MSFQEDGIASDSFISRTFDSQQQFLLHSFTFCVRFKFFGLHEITGLVWLFKNLSATSNHENNFQIELSLSRLRVSIGGTRKYFFLREELRALTWHHLCSTYNDDNRTATIVLDGSIQQSEVVDAAPVSGRILKIGAVDKNKNFYGHVTQANFWRSVLTLEEMAAIWSCDDDREGDAVAWSGSWEMNGSVSRKEITKTQLCSQVLSEQIFIFEPMTAKAAASLCRWLAATLPLPRNMTDLHKLADEISTRTNETAVHCESMWVDLTDKGQEGAWRNYFSQKQVENITWKRGQPDGDVIQNCGAIVMDDVTGFRDRDCRTTGCAVCEISTLPVWTLKGVCEISENDKKFVAKQPAAGEVVFIGYADNTIQYLNGSWLWRDLSSNETIATLLKGTFGKNWPMGRKKWLLNQPLCGKSAEDEITFLLSPCVKDEYTCDDASCVPLSKRCNLKPDCVDGSDETECEIVEFPPSYRADIPPQALGSGKGLPVTLHIVIESASVDTTDMLLHLNFNLSMSWIDKRLSYLNLNREMRQNMIPDEIKHKLWAPLVDFTNTKGNHITKVDIEASMMGCAMKLTMMSASSKLLSFDERNSRVEYVGNPQLIEYSIEDVGLTFNNNLNDFAELYVEGFILMNIYIPSLCLLVISYLTLYFKPAIFQVRVLGSLTTLLVMATLFTQASSSLPKTSYFKMVDVWLLSSILIIFTIIVFHTIIDRSMESDPVIPLSPPKEQISTIKLPSNSVRPLDENQTTEPPNSWTPSDHTVGPDHIEVAEFNVHKKIPVEEFAVSAHERTLSQALILSARVIILVVLVIFNLIYWSFVLWGN